MFKAATKRYNKSHAFLLEKYSSECFIDSLVDYPSVFHSINEDTSDFGCSSNQASSLTHDTADSDWQQSEEKSNPIRSVDSVSDTSFSTYQNGPTSVYAAKHHSRQKPNYILDSASQDSHYQEQTRQNADECQEQPIKDSSDENSEYKDSVCQGDPLVKGQFHTPIDGLFSFFEKYLHSDTCLCTGHGYDKIGRHYQNNQGLTKHIQYGLGKKKNLWSEFSSSIFEYSLGNE
jgi:hypothetical protein